MRFIGRLIWVGVAALVAGIAAAAVGLTLGAELATRAISAASVGTDRDTLNGWFAVLDGALPLWSALVSLSLIPAVLVLVVGEIGKIRSLLFYLAGGGIAIAGVPAMLRLSQAAPAPGDTTYLLVLATAGFAAGLTYWLLAGRTA